MRAFKHSPTDDAHCRMKQLDAVLEFAVDDQLGNPSQD